MRGVAQGSVAAAGSGVGHFVCHLLEQRSTSEHHKWVCRQRQCVCRDTLSLAVVFGWCGGWVGTRAGVGGSVGARGKRP